MSALFEELDRRATRMGELSVRRRFDPSVGVDVYEVKLDDEFLMSSLFTVAETELARLGLSRVEGAGLDVVVGGLGLGYTARAVLEDERVRSLVVVDALADVIEWHQQRLLPLSAELIDDPRCTLVHDDFFAVLSEGRSFGPAPRQCDAILVDIDHTPTHHLHPTHASFYTAAGLRSLAGRLTPAGVFGLWSDGGADPRFSALLDEVFASSEAVSVEFPNPYTDAQSASTVYVAVTT